MLEYRAKLANNIPHEKLLTGLDLASGYSKALIDHVIGSLHLIDSYETLQKKFNFLSDEHAKYTWKVISEITSVIHSGSEEDEAISTIPSSDEDNQGDKDSTSDPDSDDSNTIHRVQRICLMDSSSDDEHSSEL